MNSMGPSKTIRRGLRHPDVSYFPLPEQQHLSEYCIRLMKIGFIIDAAVLNQTSQRFDCFFDGCLRIHTMLVVQVDIRETKPLEGPINCFVNVFGVASNSISGKTEFRGQEHFGSTLRILFKVFADEFLATSLVNCDETTIRNRDSISKNIHKRQLSPSACNPTQAIYQETEIKRD
jgi:hypothetical protein